MNPYLSGALLLLAFAKLSSAQDSPAIQFVRAFPALEIERPVAVVIPPDDTQRLFLVQQRGKIVVLPEDASYSQADLFLDLSDRSMEEKEFEEGLLGLAFHPDFKTNRKFYIYYSQQDPKRSILSEMLASADHPNQADPASERVLLEIPQPYWNHNSGNLIFGTDGYLYVAVGDGGKRDDAARFAQNLFALNGKILRIDVNRTQGARAYGIPDDNPFIIRDKKTKILREAEGTRGEIWCYGMRNPWGLWIDPETTDFWCADVGQDLHEEINLLEKGGNFGWSYREGTGPFPKRTDPAPEGVEFIEPIHTYGRTEGLSITGGFVYRGRQMPALAGHYLYGDWRFARYWALKLEDGKVVSNVKIHEPEQVGKGVQPTAICPDAQGEALVLDWNGGIYRMAPAK